MASYKRAMPNAHARFVRTALAASSLVFSLSLGCAAPRTQAPPLTEAPAAPEATASSTRLVALLSMQQGFGPDDQDAYEARIAPIAHDHGMARRAAYTVQQAMGAPDSTISTVGVWQLATPGTLQEVMGDARYQAQIPTRDKVHDLASSELYLTEEVQTAGAPPEGHVLLVGRLVMKPGFSFEDHEAYERSIQPILERHGMRASRSFKITKVLGGPEHAVAIVLWELPRAEAFAEVLGDPEYQTHVAERDRLHDMAATQLFFVSAREDRR